MSQFQQLFHHFVLNNFRSFFWWSQLFWMLEGEDMLEIKWRSVFSDFFQFQKFLAKAQKARFLNSKGRKAEFRACSRPCWIWCNVFAAIKRDVDSFIIRNYSAPAARVVWTEKVLSVLNNLSVSISITNYPIRSPVTFQLNTSQKKLRNVHSEKSALSFRFGSKVTWTPFLKWLLFFLKMS